MQKVVDYAIHGSTPVKTIPILNKIFLLKRDESILVTANYQYTTFKDYSNWFRIVSWTYTHYEFFKLESLNDGHMHFIGS